MKIFEISQPRDFMVLIGTLVFTGIVKAEEVTDPIELNEFHEKAFFDGAHKVLWNEVTYKIQCKTAKQALETYKADMAYEEWAGREAYIAANPNHD